MSLTYDQQKNIRSLIDNAGAGTYEEVRDELYDHLVQAVEDEMARGSSFTDAQHEALKVVGGANCLQRIGRNYEITIRKQINSLMKAYAWIYLKSLRWLAPIVLGITIRFLIPVGYAFWANIVVSIIFIIAVRNTSKDWNYSFYDPKYTKNPVSLRASVLVARGVFMLPSLLVASEFVAHNAPFGKIFSAVFLIIYVLSDFFIAFFFDARKNWLEIA